MSIYISKTMLNRLYYVSYFALCSENWVSERDYENTNNGDKLNSDRLLSETEVE